jgi:hypothetical protein
MATQSLAITTDYVRAFLALVGTAITWPDVIVQRLAGDGLDRLDVMHVLKTGDVVKSEKENTYGVDMVVVGTTCDEVKLRVDFWTDGNSVQIRIASVQLI